MRKNETLRSNFLKGFSYSYVRSGRFEGKVVIEKIYVHYMSKKNSTYRSKVCGKAAVKDWVMVEVCEIQVGRFFGTVRRLKGVNSTSTHS